ncbi:MAG: hypothetical protein AAGJ40_21250 [Planctomycetota bacterium]
MLTRILLLKVQQRTVSEGDRIPTGFRTYETVRSRLSNTPGLSVNVALDSGGEEDDAVRYLLKWESLPPSHGRHAPSVIPEGPLSELVVLRIE